MWKLRKVGIFPVSCPEETVAIKTNRGRFEECWFVYDREDLRVERTSEGRTLVIRDGDHVQEPAETAPEYEVWAPPKPNRDWVFCVGYNKEASVAHFIRRRSTAVKNRWGRRGGVAVVYYKPSVSDKGAELMRIQLSPNEPTISTSNSLETHR